MTEQTYPIGCVVHYEWLHSGRGDDGVGVGYVSFETNDFPDGVDLDYSQTPSGAYDCDVLYYHDLHETVAENFWDFIKTKPFGHIDGGFTVTSIVSFTFAPSEVN